jgi:L-carnitine CoA-transferase
MKENVMFGNKNLPEWGLLSGVKVVSACQSTAGPFGAQILADFGADVLWIENALTPDLTRFTNTYAVEAQHRNMRSLALNMASEEGKKILLSLLEDADIFLETSKGGQYEKWGLSDEVLWAVKPSLIIAHVSGFGQSGLPEYVKRASYDSMAQAMSGFMFLNESPHPDQPPFAGGPYIADFVTALWLAVSVLAAVYKSKNSGEGESIDLAQYEAMAISQQYQSDWYTTHVVKDRPGFTVAGPNVGLFKCKDGKYVQICFSGAGIHKKAIPFFGLEYGSAEFPEGIAIIVDPKANEKYTKAMQDYFDQHTAKEASDAMIAAGLPAQLVYTLEDLENDPHVAARENIWEWENFKGDKVRAFAGVPKLKKHPFQIWRPAPWMGMDNEEVLADLGYTPEQIKEFYAKRIISKDKTGALSPPIDYRALGMG